VVIDTSALIAVVLKEQSESVLRSAMDQARNRLLSAVSLLEAGIILRARLGESALPLLYGLLHEIACQVVPFDEAQAKAAIAAFGRFGKGTGIARS
jgi:ribonuclease VapC